MSVAEPIDPLQHPNPGGARPLERIGDILDALGTYWRTYPDMRLVQVLGNFTPAGTDAYFVEDAFVLARLRENTPDGPVEFSVETIDLSGRHVGMLIENLTGHETYDAEFGGVYDQTNRTFISVTPDWLPVLMVTHKKNGDVVVRTKISNITLKPDQAIRLRRR